MAERRTLFPRPEGPTNLTPEGYALAHYLLMGTAEIDTKLAFPRFSEDMRQGYEQKLKTLGQLMMLSDAHGISNGRKTTLGSNFGMFEKPLVAGLLTDLLVGRLVAQGYDLNNPSISTKVAKRMIYHELPNLLDQEPADLHSAYTKVRELDISAVLRGVLEGVIEMPALEGTPASI